MELDVPIRSQLAEVDVDWSSMNWQWMNGDDMIG